MAVRSFFRKLSKHPLVGGMEKNYILFAFLVIFFLIVSLKAHPSLGHVYSVIQPNSAGVTFHHFTWPVILFLIAHYVLLCFFGYSLIYPFYVDLPDSHIVTKIWASFFAGFLATISLVRLLSLIVLYKNIYIPVLIVILVLTAVQLRKPLWNWFSLRSKNKTLWNAKAVSKGSLLLCFFLFLVFVSLMLHIKQSYYQWSGHSSLEYPVWLDYWGGYADSSVYSRHLHLFPKPDLIHFPVILQHHDEFLLNYFLTMPFDAMKKRFDPILPWWLFLGFFKISVCLFIYLCALKVNMRRFFALACTLFLVAGTSSLLAYRYFQFLDPVNPIFFTVNPGRIVGIVFALLLFLYHLHHKRAQQRLPMLFFILAGLGLTATVISNSLWIIVLALYFIIDNYLANREGPLPKMGVHKIFYALTCLAGFTGMVFCWLLFALPFEGHFYYVLRAILAFMPPVLLVIWIIYRLMLAVQNKKIYADNTSKIYTAELGVLIVVSLFGLLFLGNFLLQSEWVQGILRVMYTNPRAVMLTHVKPITVAGDFSLGDFRNITSLGHLITSYEYERGGSYFIAYFGIPMLLWLMTGYLFMDRFKKQGLLMTQDRLIRNTYLLCIAVMPMIFLLINFVNFVFPYLKSRFLEIPYYLSIFIAFYTASRFLDKAQKFWMALALIFFTITPFLATGRVQQIYLNFRLFVELLRQVT